MIAARFDEAMASCRPGSGSRQTDAIERLLRAAFDGPPMVLGDLMAQRLRAELAALWRRGWEPADVLPVLQRTQWRELAARWRKSLTVFVVLAILDEARQRPYELAVPDRWAEQLAELESRVGRGTGGATSLRQALAATPCSPEEATALRMIGRLLADLAALRPLTPVGPGPDRWPEGCPRRAATRASALDPAALSKIRGLLAKAESTTYEAEALAFTAKAQELMARHAIDRAVLDESDGDESTPQAIRIHLDDPYLGERALLLNAVAAANRCRSLLDQQHGFAVVFGFDVDLEIVEVLFTSLLVQAQTAMTRCGSQVDGRGRSTTRSFRQAFLVGFAERIGQRLWSATAEAAGGSSGGALVPLLAERERRVEETATATFPDVITKAPRAGNHRGWSAGAVAADQASLAPGAPLPTG